MSAKLLHCLGPLCSALARDDAEEGLQAGLAALARCGLVACAPSDPAPTLEVRRGDLCVALTSRSPIDPAWREVIAGVLELALARLLEQRRHQQARERMEMLSAASFEGILVHEDGVVIDVNERLEELLGAERAELLGPETMRTFVAPEDLPAVRRRVASGYEGVYLIDGVRKDGTRFRAELQSKQGRLGDRPVRVAAVRDVTERERTLELLRESEARLRELVDAAFDVSVLSREGVIVEVRGPVEEMLGYDRNDVVGRRVLDFVAPSSQPLTAEFLAEGRAGAYESVLVASSGELIPVGVVGINSTLDGLPVRVAGLRDLRELRRVDEERRSLELRLERSQRLDSLGVLAGGIAHDFNNLLAGVLGNAELLSSTVSDGESRAILQAIVNAAQRAAGLTAQMLAYAGRGGVRALSPIDLGELLSELRLLLSASLSKKAELAVEVEPGSVVLADRTTLGQVVMNLLTNASDALAGDVGRIGVRARRIQRPDSRWDDAVGSTVGPGDWVLFEVEDSGVGMDEATKARIFEPFFTTKSQGHGLGLAACLGIVASHGGALRVDSEPGRGSRFSLLLPSAARPRREAAELREPAPCRVLVVDDEPIVRSQLRRILELRGFSVIEAPDGRTGLALSTEGQVDVVILDMTMPDLDGAEVLKELRGRGCSVPVVLASGYIDAASERRLEPSSFQAFLRKPYRIADLLAAIDRATAVSS